MTGRSPAEPEPAHALSRPAVRPRCGPAGRTRTPLLRLALYDFNWQSTYTLADPLPLPAAGRIVRTATFDASAADPINPDRTAAVNWGEQTWEETMLGYLEYHHTAPPARDGGNSEGAE